MPADANYMQFIMELLEPLGDVSNRAMFGGYGIFHKGDMFALISGSTLYFKVNDSNRQSYENAGCQQFKPMPYYEVPTEILDDTVSLLDWARSSIDIAHTTAVKKKR